MRKEIALAQKLIDRKEKYLETVDRENVRDAVKAEIHILKSLLTAINVETENQLLLQIENDERQQRAYDLIKSFECICLMHGITDYKMYIEKQLPVLMGTLKDLYKKKEVIIPNQLKLNLVFNQ